MPALPDDLLSSLRLLAGAAAEQAYVPYSGRRAAAVLLLSDGAWIPGVRVESASFSLVIPPLVNAFSTAVALDRGDVVAVVLDGDGLPQDDAFLRRTPTGAFSACAPDAYVAEAARMPAAVDGRCTPFLASHAPSSAEGGISLARDVARRAHTPESNFAVGCVLELSGGEMIPGVNVEHSDWTHILCAERNALGTALSYGLSGFKTLYLSCPDDPLGSPCGACRQLLAELAPGSTLWMDRGTDAPAASTPGHLLPGYFNGQALRQVP